MDTLPAKALDSTVAAEACTACEFFGAGLSGSMSAHRTASLALDTLTITRPDDWHTHLRDGDALPRTCADMARTMGRAIVMPPCGQHRGSSSR